MTFPRHASLTLFYGGLLGMALAGLSPSATWAIDSVKLNTEPTPVTARWKYANRGHGPPRRVDENDPGQ